MLQNKLLFGFLDNLFEHIKVANIFFLNANMFIIYATATLDEK